MNYLIRTFCLFVFLALPCFVSCSSVKKPADLPDLYPTEITIIQDGKGLEGATVNLVREDGNYKWIVGGRTNASGVCKARTQGEYEGAPEGKYKVVVYKTIIEESETRKQPVPADPEAAKAYYAKVGEEEKSFDLVDLKYKTAGKTDLTVEITKGKNAHSFDVGQKTQTEFVPFGKK